MVLFLSSLEEQVEGIIPVSGKGMGGGDEPNSCTGIKETDKVFYIAPTLTPRACFRQNQITVIVILVSQFAEES